MRLKNRIILKRLKDEEYLSLIQLKFEILQLNKVGEMNGEMH
jgi:hypothetical protein